MPAPGTLWEPFDPTQPQTPVSQPDLPAGLSVAAPCTDVFLPGLLGPSQPPLLPGQPRNGTGQWLVNTGQCLASSWHVGKATRPVKVAHGAQGPVDPQDPVLPSSRVSGSRWFLPGSKRSLIKRPSPRLMPTPSKQPSRRPWRWPAGCIRQGGSAPASFEGSLAGRVVSGFRCTCRK